MVLFCAGGIATPADASLVMQLGAEGVFVGSGIFKSEDPERRALAIVEATTHYNDPARVAAVDRTRSTDDQPRDLEARGRAAAGPARLVGQQCPDSVPRPWASSRSRAISRLTPRSCARSAPSRAEVRVAADLEGLDALIIPGGESTVMTLGIEREGLAEPLRELIRTGTPCWARAPGMIMLDRDHLGVLDITAERNAFGRQLRSFEADLELDGFAGGPVHAVFIRAPWVAELGDGRRGARRGRRTPGGGPAGQRCRGRVSPRLAGETRLHELCS